MAKDRFDKRVTGSLFDGKLEVGMTLEELLQREEGGK
jgi:hypothetical protein